MKYYHTMAALIAGLLLFSSHSFATTLVSENFNSVTGIGTTQRTVQSILATSAYELAPGTTWSVTTPATAAAVNVRHTNNRINATATDVENFYKAFTPIDALNNFLVLGDDSSGLNNEALGGISHYAIPFVNPVLGGNLDISFNYAFNGWDNATGGHNSFRVYLSDGTTFINLIDFFSTPGTGKTVTPRGSNYAAGPYEHLVYTTLLNSRNLTLNFELNEGTSLGNLVKNAAAGIDNITIDSVPEPSTFILLGAGLGGLALLRRRRR